MAFKVKGAIRAEAQVGPLGPRGALRASENLRVKIQIFTHHKDMPLDQISATYVIIGSASARFPVSATKQTTPIDGAFQK